MTKKPKKPKPPRYPISRGDERNPIAKVPFYVAEAKRRQALAQQKAREEEPT